MVVASSASADYTKYAGSPPKRAVRWLHNLVGDALVLVGTYMLSPVVQLSTNIAGTNERTGLVL